MQKRKIVLRVIAGILIIAMIGFSFQAIAKAIHSKEKEKAKQTEISELWKLGKVEHNGKYYQYNDEIKTYLIMGIDSMDPVSKKENQLHCGPKRFLNSKITSHIIDCSTRY